MTIHPTFSSSQYLPSSYNSYQNNHSCTLNACLESTNIDIVRFTHFKLLRSNESATLLLFPWSSCLFVKGLHLQHSMIFVACWEQKLTYGIIATAWTLWMFDLICWFDLVFLCSNFELSEIIDCKHTSLILVVVASRRPGITHYTYSSGTFWYFLYITLNFLFQGLSLYHTQKNYTKTQVFNHMIYVVRFFV